MASFWQYFGAIAKKQVTPIVATRPLVFTKTPIPFLTQRANVELDIVPFVLAGAQGSLFRDVSGNHSVIAVSKMNYIGHDFYRCYLSNGDGTFIHIGVNPAKPDEILEQRLYQPYNEISPTYKNREDAVAALQTRTVWRSADADYPVTVVENTNHEGVPFSVIKYVDSEGAEHQSGVPTSEIQYIQDGLDESDNWEFWLLDDPNPNVGGMVGCPIMQGKNEDIDPATGAPYQYVRTWVASNQRIDPVCTTEKIIDRNGDSTLFNHTMMHYSRILKDEKIEYMLVSVVETDDGRGYVNQWIGLDVSTETMKITP